MLISLFPCRFKSDERTLADALDYVKAEVQRLKYEKEDSLKNLQEANSVACELQNEINSNYFT